MQSIDVDEDERKSVNSQSKNSKPCDINYDTFSRIFKAQPTKKLF